MWVSLWWTILAIWNFCWYCYENLQNCCCLPTTEGPTKFSLLRLLQGCSHRGIAVDWYRVSFSALLKIYWGSSMWLPPELLSPCHSHFLSQSFVSPGSAGDPLQDEGHSGSHPHLIPDLRYMCSGTSPELPWNSGFMRKSSKRNTSANMRFSILLNSWVNFFVTLPPICPKTWVI